MPRKRKHSILSMGLILAILLLSVLVPQPVLAAEIKVNTEQKLRNAVKTATAGDVNVDLKMGQLPSSFPDLPSDEAGEFIRILASNGIVKGYPDESFKPKGLVSRAEFCKILTVAMAASAVQKSRVLQEELAPISRPCRDGHC